MASAERSPGAAGDSLDRERLNPLLARRDRPGLVRFGLQALVFVGASTATASLAARDSPFALAAAILAGLALLTFFPALHEAGHGTAFRTPWLNTAVQWIAAVAMLQSPKFFQEFHFEHHRRTQDPERDPEIDAAPGQLDDWPRNLAVYLALASGQHLLVGKLAFTAGWALLPRAVLERFFPFVPDRARARVVWESRGVLGILGTGCLVGLILLPGFPAVLLAWPIAHVLLGFYLMPEHTGLPHTGTQCARTRSVESNAAVRWLMWNMPFHAVHHAQPGVPFHAVPALHRLFAARLEHVTAGYLAFHREGLRRALRPRPRTAAPR